MNDSNSMMKKKQQINIALMDINLTLTAKGIYAYIMSSNNDYDIHVSELMEHSTDSRVSIISGLKELVENGYIKGYDKN